MRRSFLALTVLTSWMIALLAASSRAIGQTCPPEETSHLDPHGTAIVGTDQYVLSVGSASGAVGDVVPVTLVLHSELAHAGRPLNLDIALCHDPAVTELVGAPIYTDEFISLLGVWGATFFSIDEDEGGTFPSDQKGYGGVLQAMLDPDAFEARFPSAMPLAIMTLYYRLKGKPGDTSVLSLCDGALSFGITTCVYNRLWTSNQTLPQEPRGWDYLSTANIDGTLRVLDGPATRPDRPSEPLEAQVYRELPSDAEIDFHVRVSSVLAWPGATGVPVDLYTTASVEYTAVLVPLDFDERYLQVRRVESNVLTGAAVVNNDDEMVGANAAEGNVVVFTGNGINNRRLAAEGEELRVATLYVDVLEAASEVTETTLEVVPVRGQSPWIGVRHENGNNTGQSRVTSRIEPIAVSSGVLAIGRDTNQFVRGDSNSDGIVDIGDAIAILNRVFLSDISANGVHCMNAANTEASNELNITDAIRLLGYLFLGDSPPPDAPPVGGALGRYTREQCGRLNPEDVDLGCAQPAATCS